MSNAPDIYDFHGMCLRVETDQPALAEPVAKALGHFASSPDGASPFVLRMRYGQPSALAPDGPQLRQFWSGALPGGAELAFYCGQGRRMIDMPGKARTLIDLDAKRAEVVVAPGAEWALHDGCITPMLCEALRSAGQHLLHAACLANCRDADSPAVLVCGPSGRGKTTAALALRRSGMTMLTDDSTFVVQRGGGQDDSGLMAWGLGLSAKVLDSTLELLGWLKDMPRRPGRVGGQYAIDLAPQADPGSLVRPVAIVFLDPPNCRGHDIGPLDKIEAVRLVTTENVRAFESNGSGPSGQTFRILARLVAQCDTYRLSAGPKLDDLHKVVRPLLSAKLSSSQ